MSPKAAANTCEKGEEEFKVWDDEKMKEKVGNIAVLTLMIDKG